MLTTAPSRSQGRADRPSNLTRRTSADFARQVTIAEFGWRFARALDQADFVDHPPGQFPAPTLAQVSEVGLP